MSLAEKHALLKTNSSLIMAYKICRRMSKRQACNYNSTNKATKMRCNHKHKLICTPVLNFLPKFIVKTGARKIVILPKSEPK